MSRSKDPRFYPPQYTELLLHLKANPNEELTLEFSSMGKANSFRLNFNSFKVAALAAKWTEIGFTNLTQIIVRVRDNPPRVVLMDQSIDEEAVAIKKAIGEKKSIEDQP